MSEPTNYPLPLDEWIEENGLQTFREHLLIHLQCVEDDETAVRMAMISLRQVLQDNKRFKQTSR